LVFKIVLLEDFNRSFSMPLLRFSSHALHKKAYSRSNPVKKSTLEEKEELIIHGAKSRNRKKAI
jgi:hypothetical protein